MISNERTKTLEEKVYETHSHSTPSKFCTYLVAWPSRVKQPILDWDEIEWKWSQTSIKFEIKYKADD